MVPLKPALRILVLATDLCYPPRSGAETRTFHLLTALAQRNSVSLLTAADPGAESGTAGLEEFCAEVRLVPKRVSGQGMRRRLGQLATLASPRSFQRWQVCTPAFQQALDQWLRADRFDMIIVDGAHLAGLRLPSGVPLVLDEHNIEYELLARHGAGERSVARRWFNQLEHLKCFREETSSWKRFDGCLFTSDREAKVMVGVAPQTKVVVVGNGVDIEYFQPHPIAVGEVRLPDPKIVFTGRMDYRPNVDAAHHLVEDVLPLVRLDHPTAQVWVVGMNPPTELTRMAARTAGVTVTGAVDDVRPYLREAAVVVAPLRMGGGTRLKILEAMAMGQAVVSTHLGCEGLDVRPDQDLLVADSPAEQAAAIAQVLSDPELASALGRSGRARVVELYGWDAVTAGLDDFVLSIVQRHRERGPNSPS